MAFFTSQGKLRTLLDSIDDTSNVVQIHAAMLYPLPREPTATVIFVVVDVASNSSKILDSSACCSFKVDTDSLACILYCHASNNVFDR